MSFDPASDVPGSRSATGYLRNIAYTTSYPPSHDRPITFPGQKTSYMFLPNTDGTFDGSDMGSWWFYIFPDPGFTYGCIIEYESTCPSGNGMSIRFKDNKIEFSGTLSNGRSFYGLSKTNIPSGQWTYIGVMWHEVYPEIRVRLDFKLHALLPIARMLQCYNTIGYFMIFALVEFCFSLLCNIGITEV